jgi:DNA modification methylase
VHPGEVVVEPFTGSGTQFVAAQKNGCVCYGMEIDPVYCDVTLDRWAEFTGQDPVRERDGVKWSKLKKKTPKV